MMDTDLAALTPLNALYIRSVAKADANTFDTILAGDFRCSNPDGTLVDKPEFLRRIKESQPFQSIDIDDVQIRVMGDVAIIHARTMFVFGDGTRGAGRYTDVWARRDGRWLAVSAHVTRLSAS